MITVRAAIDLHNQYLRAAYSALRKSCALQAVMMQKLSRLCPDQFTLAMIATVTMAFVLPCDGAGTRVFSALTSVAIALLFFLQGARLSRSAIFAGALHWRLHLLVFATTFALFPLAG